MKVIIAGGREFYNYDLLELKCDKILSNVKDVEIVCGMAKGADQLGNIYASLKGFKVKKFPADWKNLGLKAGPIRNLEMANYADALIIFWDQKSSGSKDMIKQAKNKGLIIRVIKY